MAAATMAVMVRDLTESFMVPCWDIDFPSFLRLCVCVVATCFWVDFVVVVVAVAAVVLLLLLLFCCCCCCFAVWQIVRRLGKVVMIGPH